MSVVAMKESDYETTYSMLTAIRGQIERFTKHGFSPAYVIMTASQYAALGFLDDNIDVCHNLDKESVSGLPIVISEEISRPTVTVTIGSLGDKGLL